MKIAELITILREDYLDDTLGVDENDSLISQDALIRFAAQAEDQACRRGNFIFDKTTAEIATIELVADQRSYQFHEKITVLKTVSYDGNELIKTTEENLNDYYPGWNTADTGTPTHYYVRGRTIYLYPVPGTVEALKTLDLETYRRPITNYRSEQQRLEIFEEAQPDLVYWMLYRVYNLRDEDLKDPTQASYYHQLFTEVYGPVVPLRVRIHQFETPESLNHTSPDRYTFTGSGSEVDPDFDDSRGW
jgi:hypothetical protein